MEPVKDYYERYKAMYSKKDMDDTRFEYALYGIGATTVIFVILISLSKLVSIL